MVYTNLDKKPKNFERNVFFYEIYNEQKVDHAELRYQPEAKSDDQYFKDKPFVGFTRTEEQFKHHGLARKRLFALDVYSEIEWGLLLYSGDQNVMTDGVWQSLVRDGLAEKIPSNNKHRKRYKLLLTTLKNQS